MDITFLVDGMYWGVLVSTMLFGITISQGWTYAYDNNDRWHLRLLVAVLILMDFATTCLSFYILRYYLISNFGNLTVLETLTRPIIATIGIIFIVTYLSTLFFASRIYLLDNGSLWVAVTAALFATGHFVTIILVLDGLRKDPRVFILPTVHMRITVGIGLSCFIVSVSIITAALSMKLYSRHSYFKTTQTMLQRLLLFVVTRGVLVVLNLISFLIVYELQSYTLNWAPFLLFSPKLQVTSMVAMLNLRIRSHNAMHFGSLSDGEQRHFNTQHRVLSFSQQKYGGDTGKIHGPLLEISVEKSVQVP